MKIIIGFAGGGGVEAGMIQSGLSPTLSIEHDPEKPELSKSFRDVHRANFNTPLFCRTVQEWASMAFPGSDGVDFAHFSPVCCNFSTETNRGDLEKDISSAIAIAGFIEKKRPLAVTIENVPAYKSSYSWNIVLRSLTENGYMPNIQIVNFADYGVPQSRKRFFCVALRGGWFPEIPKQNHISWHESVADLIPNLEETQLTKNQKKSIQIAIENSSEHYRRSLPVLIPRVGYRDIPRLTPHWKPAPTIKRAIFDDSKGSGRSQAWTIWDGQKALNCDIEVFRRLQTFPQWYKFPDEIRVAGSIIGNSVPPLFSQKVYSTLTQVLTRQRA